jgi:hypothetical protein
MKGSQRIPKINPFYTTLTTTTFPQLFYTYEASRRAVIPLLMPTNLNAALK